MSTSSPLDTARLIYLEEDRLARFLDLVRLERAAQIAKWGDQRHDDGTGMIGSASNAAAARIATERAAARGDVTWKDILAEEMFEAFAESDPEALRTELVQCAAVIGAWISDIDRRARPESGGGR